MGGPGSGRHAIPTPLKVLRGTFRPDRDGPRLTASVTPRPRIPAAPRHLSARSRKLWRAVCREYEIDDAGRAVLMVALQAYDRLEQARLIVAREGLLLTGPRGAVRANPALRIERDARAGFLAAVGRLGLEVNA